MSLSYDCEVFSIEVSNLSFRTDVEVSSVSILSDIVDVSSWKKFYYVEHFVCVVNKKKYIPAMLECIDNWFAHWNHEGMLFSFCIYNTYKLDAYPSNKFYIGT